MWANCPKCAETVELVKQAMSRRIRVYVLVNNPTQGNAPRTD
jgi:hypothetical protein